MQPPFTLRVVSSLFWLLASSSLVFSQDTLWINHGTWHPVSDTLSGIRLNASPAWDTANVVIELPTGLADSRFITNNDTLTHDFLVYGIDAPAILGLAPGETALLDLSSATAGTYRYSVDDAVGRALGGGGPIRVGAADWEADGAYTFYWNLADWDAALMDSTLANVETPYTALYAPKFFTINSRAFPHTLEDENAMVLVPLGSTSYISIVNSGRMDHVLHFHGFHAELLTSSHHPERVGWSKDTFPVLRGECLTVKLTAFQTGVYPVHNHNMIVVTNAGFYPGGQLTYIEVE